MSTAIQHDVFDALADPTRRAIVEHLARRPRTAGELVAAFPISQPAISRHLRVLRESGLVEAERPTSDARRRRYQLDPDALESVDRWMRRVRTFWQAQLDAFAAYVTDSRNQ